MKMIATIVLTAMATAQPSIAAPVDPASAARTVLKSYMTAWAHSDAAGLGSYYAVSGDFISPNGLLAVGPKEVEAFYASAFKRGYAGSQATFKPIKTRFVSQGVIAIDGEWSISGAHKPGGQNLAPEAGIATAVLIEGHGRWRIALLREQAGASHIQALAP